MGRDYRRNIKNQYGRPAVIGQDVVELTASVGQAPGGAAPLSDSLGAASYVSPSDARLLGVVIQATGTLGLGRLGVEVLLAGSVVASGNLYAGGPSSKYIKLAIKSNEDVAVGSGQALTANVSVEQSLDTGQAVRASLSLDLLEYSEKV